MMDQQSVSAPAGWYSDPAGQAGERWWDGASWSATTRPGPEPARPAAYPSFPQPAQSASQPISLPNSQPVAQPIYEPGQPELYFRPAQTFPTYGQAEQVMSPAQQPPHRPIISPPAYAPMQGFGVASRNRFTHQVDPRSINPSTEYFWRIAFWPLTTAVAVGLYVLMGGITASVSRDTSTALTALGAFLGASLLFYLLFVVAAYQDSRELKARQLPGPFGWGWGFIPIVYLIGRSAVVYSRTGRGLAPLFVCIGVWIVTNAVVIPMIFVISLGGFPSL